MEPGRPALPPDRPVFGPPAGSRRSHDLNLPRRYSRWALWGCFTLVLSGLLLGAGFLLVTMQQPDFRKVVKSWEARAECHRNLSEVSGALDRYHTDKGRLPARLEELYPTYITEREYLYCPEDPASPYGPGKRPRATAGSSYMIRPGVSWGNGKETVVLCPHHENPVAGPDGPQEERPQFIPVIREDGSVYAIMGRPSEVLAGTPGERSPGDRPPSQPSGKPGSAPGGSVRAPTAPSPR